MSEDTGTLTPAVVKEEQDGERQPTVKILSLPNGIGTQRRPLFSSLPLKEEPSDEDETRHPTVLPGGLVISELHQPEEPTVDDEPDQKRRDLAFRDLFAPPRYLPDLARPRRDNAPRGGNALSWRNTAAVEADSWPRKEGFRQPYMDQVAPVAQWISYSSGPQLHVLKNGEDANITDHSLCAEPRCQDYNSRKRKFTRAFSSFAPSYDQDVSSDEHRGCLISVADRNAIAWTRQTADQFAIHFGSECDIRHAFEMSENLPDYTLSSEELEEIKNLGDLPINDPPLPPINAHERISRQLARLAAVKRGDMLDSVRPRVPETQSEVSEDVKKFPPDPTTDPTELEAELRSELVSMILDAPPRLVTKRRGSSRLVVSKTLTREGHNFRGRLIPELAPTQQQINSHAAQANAAAALMGTRYQQMLSHSAPRMPRNITGQFPVNKAMGGQNMTPTQYHGRDDKFAQKYAASVPRINGSAHMNGRGYGTTNGTIPAFSSNPALAAAAAAHYNSDSTRELARLKEQTAMARVPNGV